MSRLGGAPRRVQILGAPAEATEAHNEQRFRSFGRCDEWHLDFYNAFRHIVFDVGARPRQPAVVIASMLFHSRFEAIRTVSHSMGGDGIEHVLVQLQAMGWAVSGLKVDHRLECFQGLTCALRTCFEIQLRAFARRLDIRDIMAM